MTLPDRERALQILGLSEGAELDEIQSAHAALRAHVERRAGTSSDESFREERRAELLDLERALNALSSDSTPGAAMETAPASRPSRLVPRWILGWAIVATVIAASLAVYLSTLTGSFGPSVLVAGSGEGGSSGGSGGFAIEGDGADPATDGPGDGDAASAGERAKLVAKSPIEGAVLEVRTRGDGPETLYEVVASGAADETVYWLAPGAYSLEVSHADCKDTWSQQLDARGGEEHEFAPEVCSDVGWMVVRSNVAEDKLSIDGREVGETGDRQHALPAGEHQVRVEKRGYQAWEGIVEVEPGRILGIRPRLEAAAKAKPQSKPRPRRPQVASAPRAKDEDERKPFGSWHDEARQWLLARYDHDRSGALDSAEELESVPCERWLGLEESHDQSRLGLSLTRFYGFDGNRWRSGALGVSDEVRDLAYERMKECGLE